MGIVRSAAAMCVGFALVACGSTTEEGAATTAAAVTTAAPAFPVVRVRPTDPTSPPSSAPAIPEGAPEPAATDPAPTPPPATASPVPTETVWPPYEPLPGVDGLAALTGLAADAETTARPVLAVKIDNHPRARPQWGLDAADVVVEENVEGLTRFIALFHSRRPPSIGPVRSARSGDLAVLAAFNRPVLGWSGGNPGVTRAVRAAADAGVLIDLSALRQGSCYRRAGERRVPHNLVLDPLCALDRATDAGSARAAWTIDASWVSPSPYGPDTSFSVPMDGVEVGWTWDATLGLYVRSQDGAPHLTMSGVRVMATNVLVLEVRHVASSIDARSPEPVTVGAGDGVLHRDGLATLVHWSRVDEYSPFVLTTRDTGAVAALAPGTSFVELMRAP